VFLHYNFAQRMFPDAFPETMIASKIWIRKVTRPPYFSMVLALLTIGTMALAPLYLSLNPNLCCSLLLHPNSPPLLLRAGSTSLFIDARRLPVYCCCVHAPPPSLFVFLHKNLPYSCTIYLILAFSLVLYLTLFFCLNGSVYFF
jgi:hypothetical protein